MNPKLTESQVQEVRACARAGMPIGEIAERFGVTVRPIRWILQGKAWTHVPDPAGAGPVQYVSRTTTHGPSSRPPRPLCPSCSGLLEADINQNDEPFIACERCLRVWSGSVTDQERQRHESWKLGRQEQEQHESDLATDQSHEVATQGMAAATP